MAQHQQQAHLAKKAQQHMQTLPFEMMLDNAEPVSKFPSLDMSAAGQAFAANAGANAA